MPLHSSLLARLPDLLFFDVSFLREINLRFSVNLFQDETNFRARVGAHALQTHASGREIQ
jgi:hypothetical protein